MADELNVVKEALVHYRSMWAWWLELKMTTEAERELARTKIALIDRELADMAESEGQRRVNVALAEIAASSLGKETDPRRWNCKNQGCGEEIEQTGDPSLNSGWVHTETKSRLCDVSPRNPAYGGMATPI